MFSIASKWITEPTKNNTNRFNCHQLIEIRDTLMEKWSKKAPLCNSKVRLEAIRGMFNFIISKYERDNVNGSLLDDFFYEWAKRKWIFRDKAAKEDLFNAIEAKEYHKVMDLIR